MPTLWTMRDALPGSLEQFPGDAYSFTRKNMWQGGSMKTRLVLVLALVTTAVAGGVGTPPAAIAAGSTCGSGFTHIWGRALDDGAPYMAGAQADMTVRQSNLCGSVSTNGNTASACVMISGVSGNDGFAQNGYIRHAGGCDCRQFFYEFEKYLGSNNGPVFIPNTGTGSLPWGNPDVGAAFVFKTTWKYGTGEDNKIHAIFCLSSDNSPPGGTGCYDYANTNWNPSGASWFGADSVWAGETHDAKTDMPGTQGANAISRYMLARRYVPGPISDPWYDPGTYGNPATCTQIQAPGSGTCHDSYFRYHLEVVNATRFDIWTCPIDPNNPPC